MVYYSEQSRCIRCLSISNSNSGAGSESCGASYGRWGSRTSILVVDDARIGFMVLGKRVFLALGLFFEADALFNFNASSNTEVSNLL